MPLLSSTKKQLVLYNRSGIAAPFVVKMERYQAYDPHKHAKRMGKVPRNPRHLHIIEGGRSGVSERVLVPKTVYLTIRIRHLEEQNHCLGPIGHCFWRPNSL